MIRKQFTLCYLAVICFLSTAQPIFSQVKGISYTISPAVAYSFWDDNAGLENGFQFGGRVGFGFGENLELRGVYMRTINQKTDFSSIELPNFSNELYNQRDVTLSRIGGELKINVSRGKLLPFVTLGTGIQSIKLEDYTTNKQIYASLGAGVTVSIADRFTINLEGKNMPYNFNAGKYLLSPEDKTMFNLTDDDFQSKQLQQNWLINASVQIYLGGRRPGELSDLDQAYEATFSDGIKGLRIPFEPTLTRINWHKDLPYRDAWMGGAYLGLDFGPYMGIRGFYLRAMEDGNVKLKFDPLTMYGGELRAKLSVSGFTPYLMFGGGYIEVSKSYEASSPKLEAKSQAFASGGVGLNIPIAKRFKVFGGVRAILTAGTDVEDIENTEDIKNSWSYSFGLSLVFGKKANKQKTLYQPELGNALDAQKAENERNRKLLEEKYEQRIVKLDKNLTKAIEKQDTAKVVTLKMEKEESEAILEELKIRPEKREAEMVAKLKANPEELKKYYEGKIVQLEADLNNAYAKEDFENAKSIRLRKQEVEAQLAKVNGAELQQPDSISVPAKASASNKVSTTESRVVLSPLEFERLIEEILESTQPSLPYPVQAPSDYSSGAAISKQRELEARILSIEQILQQIQLKLSTENSLTTPPDQNALSKSDLTNFSDELKQTIQELRDQIQKNSESIKQQLDTQNKILDQLSKPEPEGGNN